MDPWSTGQFFGLAIVLLTAVGLMVLDYGLGEGGLSWAYWQQGGGTSTRSEILRNFGILAAALICLGFGILRAWTAHVQVQASTS